jgi:hypothetical protein
MNFVHEDLEFGDLLQIASEERKFSRGIIEKDYWVAHALWSLNVAGFEVWFKGGTVDEHGGHQPALHFVQWTWPHLPQFLCKWRFQNCPVAKVRVPVAIKDASQA